MRDLRILVSLIILVSVVLPQLPQAIVGLPFTAVAPPPSPQSCYLDASSLNITSIQMTDLIAYYDQWARLLCMRVTIDLSNNQLVQLPTMLFMNQGTQAIRLSHNLFTSETIRNFFSNDSRASVVFPGTRWEISLDLSSNLIGPLPPTIFQFMNVDQLICQNCGLTSLPYGSFSGAQITKLDLSYNDFSLPGSIPPRVFDRLTTSSIVLNNCNLRTSSLPPSGLFHATIDLPLPLFVSITNDPLAFSDNLTPASYRATWPNIFVDLTTSIFSPPTDSNLVQLQVATIRLGDFISFQGDAGLFIDSTWNALNEFSVSLAPTVAIEAIGNVTNWCPAQQFARAVTDCSLVVDTLTISAFGSIESESVPDVPECTFPNVTCDYGGISHVSISTEPVLLQRGLLKWINDIASDASSIAWIPPTGNNFNPALNRSDWMPQDMLCDLTRVTTLTLPGLPYPQFSFPPPEGMLACLTSTIYNIDWSQSELFSSGMFGGRPDTAPSMNVGVDLNRLYAGDRPVPVDFFAPLVAHLTHPLNSNFNTSDPYPYTFYVCSNIDCPHAPTWLLSHCPYIVDQYCVPCPDGYFPQTITAVDDRLLYYCKSSPAGSYVAPYSDSSQSPLPRLCQTGSFQPMLHQTSCLDCSPGSYNPLTGSSSPAACIMCQPGTANPFPGGNSTNSCIPCQPGTASPSAGVAECLPCATGTYQNQTGQFQCLKCPANTYLDQTGSQSLDACISCPTHARLSAPGSTSSQSCSAALTCPDGAFTSTNLKLCQSLCPTGSYCQGGQISKCPPGSFSNITGLGTCHPCGVGYYSSVIGSATIADCHPCPLSTYSSDEVSSSCQPCSAGAISTVSSSSSNDTCFFEVACSVTSDDLLVPRFSNSSYCQTGSVAPFQLNQLLPEGIALMEAFRIQLIQQSAIIGAQSLTSVNVTRAYRHYPTTHQAASLRLAEYSVDDRLTLHGATEPSTDTNSIGSGVGAGDSVMSSRTITMLIIFVLIAFVSWPFYQRIPSALAFYSDQFSMFHHINAGQSPVKQPTKFGSAVTWTFLWIAILVAILLGSASNIIITTSLVPPSSISYAGTATADFQITIRGYGSNSTVSQFCTNSSGPFTMDQDGFNDFFYIANPKADVCSIAANCFQCKLGSGSSSVSFTFPYDTQFFEWELFVSSAAPQTWSRRYGVLTQLPGHLFDSQSELRFSVIESYYTDHTQSGDGTRQSGFELDFSQYTSIQPQSQATYNPNSTVTIKFVLNKSDIMFDSYSTNKLSAFQLFVSILTAIVSLFTIFGIIFNKFERFILGLLFHRPSGELRKDNQGRIQLGHETGTNDVVSGSISHAINPISSDSVDHCSSEIELEINPVANVATISVKKNVEMIK